MEESAPAADSQIEIAHVLFIDVVGYSKRLIDEQREIMAELTSAVRNATRVRVAEVAGKLLRLPTGNGVALVFFENPEAPLEAAIEITRGLKADPRIQLRMGIHSGPVNRVADVNARDNVAGAGVDFAQRVMDCGDAGHILISRRVAYDLAPSARWNPHLFEIGECEVKHSEKISLVNFHTPEAGNAQIPGKVQRFQEEQRAREKHLFGMPRALFAALCLLVLLLLGSGIFFYQRHVRLTTAPIPPPPPPEKSIAVLPFADLSAAHDQEYFCDGMSEEILDALSRVDGLRVIARTSSFAFKNKGAEPPEIGRKLNVASLLQGSLRREGNRVRVSARLINAADGVQLWSKTFEEELKSVFEVQDEITRQIVDALKIKLAVATRAQTVDPTAYDLYLKGLYFSNKSSEEDLRIGLGLFEEALQKDPKLGRAWTGVAKVWLWLSDAYVKPLQAMPRVEAAAKNALAIDERDADAHAYLAEAKRILSYDIKGAESELKQALQIDPNSAAAHLFLSLVKSCEGERQLGLTEMKTAVRLDPLSPIVGNFEVVLDVANDRLDDAFTAAKRTMEIDPDYIYFEPNLAMVYREQGKLKEALDIYERLALTQKQPTAGLAITYARLGRKEDARKVLTQLVRIAETRYFAGEQIASVYAALGDREAAFYWLERAVAEHSAPIHGIAVRPEFRSLRDDPRFPDVLRRIGLDPATALKH